MDDKSLIEMVATIWVTNGGDVSGFGYCIPKIKDAIKRKYDHSNS